jgi:DNA-binding GntR family transcriptional regulator
MSALSSRRNAGDRRGLGPLKIETTPSLVAARIRDGIFDGTFRPGAQLNEVEIARELGISRGPIREAFQRLIHEGLLRAERNRGVFVVALDEDAIRDVYFVRDVVERAAALQLASSRDKEALRRLKEILQSMESALDGDWLDLVGIDLEFHQSLIHSAHSSRLERAFEPICFETRLCLSYLEAYYEHRQDLVDEHRAIYEAIRSGDDARLVERLVREHMTESAAKLTGERGRNWTPLPGSAAAAESERQP